jgi:hypothetical protein
MNAKDAAASARPTEVTTLDGRYGKIGISAVAAAVRYNGDAKNPAYAPAVPRGGKRFDEQAEMAAA